MPLRPFTRDQMWLLPPSLDELLPMEHPARYVGAFVDALDGEFWQELEVDPAGDPFGRPAYDPRVLLSAWLYGFMIRIRSSRKLEGACRDQIPFLWLTGFQRPDHNTLWRFYQGHRRRMRTLLKETVRTAVQVGLTDLALQAVDGTKMAGNVAQGRAGARLDLSRLMERTEVAIADLEDQNERGEDELPPSLPQGMREASELAARIREARGPAGRNQKDSDARVMKSQESYLIGYNAQAMVAPLIGEAGGGYLITAAEVSCDPSDTGHLVPMIEEAAVLSGVAGGVILADAGYFSGQNLEACAERQRQILMPDPHRRRRRNPFHKDNFVYDPQTDTYTCPLGQPLHRVEQARGRDGSLGQVYKGAPRVCRPCPAFGVCTTDGRNGRRLKRGSHEEVLVRHRQLMATAEARNLYRKRKQLAEPVFAIIKEHLGVRRFLLRGLASVRGEWDLLMTAFNLRSLAKEWACGLAPPKPPTPPLGF